MGAPYERRVVVCGEQEAQSLDHDTPQRGLSSGAECELERSAADGTEEQSVTTSMHPADIPGSFDAVVVGSGATGGWAAKELTEAGLTVALVEAGPELSSEERAVAGASNLSTRQEIQAQCGAFYEGDAHLFVDDVDNPYTTPEDEPFEWIRSRVVGGRMHLWGRMALRMSDRELKAASHDGEGVDWPISYADLAPYYDRVESFLKVRGARDGLPQVPDGIYAAPPRFSTGEVEFKRAIESRWSTRRVIGARIVEASPEATIDAARATGRLTLMPNSVVSRVLMGAGDRVSGVAFVDTLSGAEREISGGVVMLCASTVESTRLLLNSASASHPDGLANSSGLLGRYLFDHAFGVRVEGRAPTGIAPHAGPDDPRLRDPGLPQHH